MCFKGSEYIFMKLCIEDHRTHQLGRAVDLAYFVLNLTELTVLPILWILCLSNDIV